MPKESKKSRVLVAKKSTKKWRFKGTPKQKIEADKRVPKDTITYVDETRVNTNTADAVAENEAEPVVTPPVSASKRKIELPKTSGDDDFELQTATGYRLVAMDSLGEFLTRLHSLDGCSGESNFGHAVRPYFSLY